MRALFMRAFGGQFLVEALVRLRSLIILPIATRILGPTGYGWIAFAAALTGLVGTVATLGMPQALARFLPGKESEDDRARIFWPTFAASAVTVTVFAALTVGLFAVAPLAPHGIPFTLIVVAAVNVVSNELKLFMYGFWRINVEYGPYYRFQIADVVLAAAAQLTVLVVLGDGAIAVLVATIAVDFLLLTTGLIVLRRRFEWHRPTSAIVGPLYRYGLPLGLSALLVWANNTADRFFVQGYRGSAAVGVYSVGYNLGTLAVAIVGTPMINIVASFAFRAWDRGDRERAERIPRRSATILVLVCMPAILSLGFFGRPFVVLVAGREFALAHEYVALVAVGYLLLHLGVLFGYPLWLNNRQNLYAVSMIVSVAINIAGNALLVPPYGALGSAIATTASLGILAVALVAWNYHARYSRPEILLPTAIAVTAVGCWAAAAVLWPSSPTIVDTIVFSAVTTVAFAGAAFALRLVPAELHPNVLRRRLAAS